MQPKTLQDYRDLTKVLKLKIVKQSKIIQQLQTKCQSYEQDLNNITMKSKNGQTHNGFNLKHIDELKEVQQQLLNTLQGKSKVMLKFLKGTKIFGITPQAVFRIADQGYTQCVQSDFFRTVLSKMSLNLNPKQISSLIYIFDQNFSGYITKQDYENSLYAYTISLQGNCLLYTQECLLKLCSLLQMQKADLNKFYDEMKSISIKKYNGKIGLLAFQEQIKNYFNGRLKQRQIIGAYNQINLQKQSSIDKKNFLYAVNSFSNRLGQQRFKSDNVSQFASANNLKNSRSQLKIPAKTQLPNPPTNLSGFQQIKINNEQKYDQQSSIDSILQKHHLTFNDIINTLIEQKFTSRIGLHLFKKIFSNLFKQFSLQQISEIFKSIDYNQNGSIDLNNIINFVLSYYKDPNMIFRLIGKSFQINQTTPEQFWYLEEFQDLTRIISKQKFIQIMTLAYHTENSQNWNVIWNYFDKGKGNVVIQNIVDIWKKFYVEKY